MKWRVKGIKYIVALLLTLILTTSLFASIPRDAFLPNGHLNAGVATQTLAYNANGSLTARTEGSHTVTYAYNALNQLTNYTDSATNRIGYAYNAGGLLSELTYPDGKVVHYRYDSRNRLTEVEDWAARITRYTYDLRGRLVGINHPNGTSRTNLYDTVNRLLQIRDTDASGRMICQYDFTFDDADRITTELYRPVNWPCNPPDVDCTFDGDNRITSYNGQALSYDADGNLLQLPSNGVDTVTLTYDTRNRLQSVGGLSYVYDPSGHRIAVSNTAGATTFVINPNAALSQVLIRKKPDGTTTYYVYGLGLLYEETGTALRQYHSDLRGSTTVLTDGAGAVTDRFSYTPYGMMNARSGTTDTPFLYNGKYGVQTDANGLLHMRARYYSPILRRFMTTDPIGLEGGQNYYAFADGNPLVYIDPFGLCAESSGGYSGGWGNPGNWWRGIYTGDPNASDEVYDAALDASSDYMLYEGGVRGGYIGVGKGLKVPGKGNLAGMGGIRANWTIDRGKSASVDVGLGLQDRGRTTVLGLGTKPFVSQTIGMGVLMSFGLRRRAFKTQ